MQRVKREPCARCRALFFVVGLTVIILALLELIAPQTKALGAEQKQLTAGVKTKVETILCHEVGNGQALLATWQDKSFTAGIPLLEQMTKSASCFVTEAEGTPESQLPEKYRIVRKDGSSGDVYLIIFNTNSFTLDDHLFADRDDTDVIVSKYPLKPSERGR